MIEKIINEIPDYKEFLTTDEMDANSLKLAKDHPDVVSVKSLGKSRKGHDVYCLTIGKGSKNVLMFGCPHPNEPMGAMMLEYLSKKLAEDDEFRQSFDFTWHLIKSIDIDGTKLNEGWFKGDLTLTKYARNFFRPAGYEQVEWTYPFDYKGYIFDQPLPETKMLMKLMDDLRPEFVYSLHNAGFGGTYWYISKELKSLWEPFYKSSEKQDIPLHLGEPEVNYITPFAPAIYPMINSKDTYDYYESLGEKDVADLMGTIGTSTDGYLEGQGINSTVLVTELPYFFEERIASDKVLDKTRKEAFIEGLDYGYKQMKEIDRMLENVKTYFSEDNPFYKMVEVSVEYSEKGYTPSKKFVEKDPEYQKLCKESEDFDSNLVRRFYMLLSWGLALRSCEHELEKQPEGKEKQALLEAKKTVEAAFNERAEEVEDLIHYQVIPIKKLVSIQLECGLLLMKELQEGEAK